MCRRGLPNPPSPPALGRRAPQQLPARGAGPADCALVGAARSDSPVPPPSVGASRGRHGRPSVHSGTLRVECPLRLCSWGARAPAGPNTVWPGQDAVGVTDALDRGLPVRRQERGDVVALEERRGQ